MSTSNLPRFNDTAQAFQHLTDGELRRAVALFSLIGKPWLVNVGSALANLALALRIPLGWAVRPTVYAHFSCGESIDDSEETKGGALFWHMGTGDFQDSTQFSRKS